MLPLPAGPGLGRRLARCALGLVLAGLGIALTVQAELGLAPWDVLHQGLGDLTGIPMGTVSILVGLVILLLWIPLGQRVGIGTLLNVFLIGASIDVFLPVLPIASTAVAQWSFLAAGLLLMAVGSGLYLGVNLGAGPRDGLMMGFKARGWNVAVARTGIELTALGAGWLLGGRVGIGTVVSALGIGPLVHWALPRFAHRPAAPNVIAPLEA